MVEYPCLQELVAETLMGLAAHSVFVHQGFQDLSDVLLAQEAIATCQVN